MIKLEPQSSYHEATVQWARALGHEEAAPAALHRLQDAPPRLLNLPSLTLLADADRFAYKGVWYDVPTIPWRKGLELLYSQYELEALPHALIDVSSAKVGEVTDIARAQLTRAQGIAERVVALFWVLALPAGDWWLQRLVRRRRYAQANPFADMTLGEMVALMAFFSECRMKRPDLRLTAGSGASSDVPTFSPT